MVLRHQLRSPLLVLLLLAAGTSYLLGERSSAVIIAVIVVLSVGLGFVNEFRAENSAEALHSQIRHRALAMRDGERVAVDGTELVPGDIVDLHLGDIVPADLRLIDVTGLECDESLLTGESLPAEKSTEAVSLGTALADLSGAALMGTVVHAGSAVGVVVATGPRTEFGKIAAGLDTHQLDTQFQVGLSRFLDAPRVRRRLTDDRDIRDQRGAASAGHGCVAVLVGLRRRHHPLSSCLR